MISVYSTPAQAEMSVDSPPCLLFFFIKVFYAHYFNRLIHLPATYTLDLFYAVVSYSFFTSECRNSFMNIIIDHGQFYLLN